jgi:hypothetical protein
MWENKKDKLKYDQKDDITWVSPYIVKKKSKKEQYYLKSLDGRNIPLPVDGSLLQPYVQGT